MPTHRKILTLTHTLGDFVPVPPGDTTVWTGRYTYKVVKPQCQTREECEDRMQNLRLNFRGVRWSVTVHDYVAQLTQMAVVQIGPHAGQMMNVPWAKYDGSPGHDDSCDRAVPARVRNAVVVNGVRCRPGAPLAHPNCTHPQNHGTLHSKTWWALYQPGPDQPTQFTHSAETLHRRILRLFGAGAVNVADRWAAPDRNGGARWLQTDTDDMAWLIGLWLADGSSDEASIVQTDVHNDGTNDHAEACAGIRRLAILVWRLRTNLGTQRAAAVFRRQPIHRNAAIPAPAAAWTDFDNKKPTRLWPHGRQVAGDLESQLAHQATVGSTGNIRYTWYPDFQRGSRVGSWFRVLLEGEVEVEVEGEDEGEGEVDSKVDSNPHHDRSRSLGSFRNLGSKATSL